MNFVFGVNTRFGVGPMYPEIVVFTKFLFFVALASKSEPIFTKFKFEPNIYFGSAYGCEKLFFTNNKLCEKVCTAYYIYEQNYFIKRFSTIYCILNLLSLVFEPTYNVGV